MPTHENSYPPTHFRARKERPWWHWRPSKLFYLRCLWCFLIFYQEFYLFKTAFKACYYDEWTSPALPTNAKIGLIGDPQLVDENTYARRGVALAITKFYTDLYMRKNYKLLNRHFTFNTTIFTGDLFDGGREWDDKTWAKEYQRFQKVFPQRSSKHVITSMPGNHDIGFSDGVQTSVYKRFRQAFGETTQSFEVGAWEVVVLDTVAMSSPNAAVSKFPRDWLAKWQKAKSDKPKMLITHVPLYREPDAPCGPLRESNSSIKIQRGYQYQNVLDPAVSEEIWEIVKPSVIFAGDDHDYCDYQHENGIHEFNVKTFSWAMGVKRPGFQMVSVSGTRYETKLCLLPGQLPIFGRYAAFLGITCLSLLILASRSTQKRVEPGLPRTNKDDDNKRRTTTKRKPLHLLKVTARDLGLVAWPVLIYYLYMIWC
ncbi:protein of unknown function [Taphrina deformans PYCC 5710]|uniref:Calcineurin-like phosphoesterase domain-containing protein n=1 Tax=Taphrina deformans (strain PYCC 5710 / ATCC 11124 / CBS 356.35 / IMI 108563 / JCM 9778 / NBRC 8474) TaxID=1097556 RepID=R4XFX6_TAPDE|nr:protein of unknown function [Taphrina deformans PYCC 5710]|eukprot:CCG84781.1 protein of unknown function [Taphrina deformans PYCC 5710]